MTALAETWLLAFLLVTGFGLGAALALALGRLLSENWLEALHPPLAALARFALPAGLLLALPMGLFAPMLWPWGGPHIEAGPRAAWYAPGFVHLRSLALLALWTALAWWVAAGGTRRRGGIALAALLLTGAVAMEDWALSRDPGWTGSIQGVALLAQMLAAALGVATLAVLRRAEPRDAEARTGLERALLSLALAVLWLWFTQFLVVYAADIPAEAAWYMRRGEGSWGVLKSGVALPALLLAIALAILPQWGGWRFGAVSALLVVNHLAHLVWLVRPEAAPGTASPLLDAAALALSVGLAMLVLRRA